jgi:hypothetical protein
MSALPEEAETGGLRDRLAHLVAANRSLIERIAGPLLRGTPFTPDDVYSEVQFNVARTQGWFWRMWTENDGSFSDAPAAVARAAQEEIRSLIRDWKRDLAKRDLSNGDSAVAEPRAVPTPASDPGAWADQYADHQRILDAVGRAGLTEGEACLVRSRLDDVTGEEADRRLAHVLGRGEPDEMTKAELDSFKDYRRKIQERAYRKIRWYLGDEGRRRHE